jgi:hypothetical protein
MRIGDDFPDQIRVDIESWRCSLFINQEVGKLSTRGHLIYKDELGSNSTVCPMLLRTDDLTSKDVQVYDSTN